MVPTQKSESVDQFRKRRKTGCLRRPLRRSHRLVAAVRAAARDRGHRTLRGGARLPAARRTIGGSRAPLRGRLCQLRSRAGLRSSARSCAKAPGFPLAWFGLFADAETIPTPDVGWAAEPVENKPGGPGGPSFEHDAPWRPSISADEYAALVVEFRERIAAGETYQVNYTFRLRQPAGDPCDLFRAAGRGPAGALCGLYRDGPTSRLRRPRPSYSSNSTAAASSPAP